MSRPKRTGPTTGPRPLLDPDVLKASCPRKSCVLNEGHDASCRTHYQAGDRVLRFAHFALRRVRDTDTDERRSTLYVKVVSPCCGEPSWEPAAHFTWREEYGFEHRRRCGYRADGSGKKRTGGDGCGWSWTIEPIHPDHREVFAEGADVPIVWVAGQG